MMLHNKEVEEHIHEDFAYSIQVNHMVEWAHASKFLAYIQMFSLEPNLLILIELNPKLTSLDQSYAKMVIHIQLSLAKENHYSKV